MARELFEQLRKIADTGKIVIVITHTPDHVIDLFDDVIVLAKDSARTGRLAYYGPIEEAKKFFGRDSMEKIVKSVNRVEEGGDGLADEFVMKYVRTGATPQSGSAGSAGLESEGFAPAGRACQGQGRDCSRKEVA